MLEQISIKNFALIEDLTLTFHPELNVFTGETGAGKTILIDALSAALGDRLDLVSLRLKDRNCAVEAVFALPENALRSKEAIARYTEDGDDVLILRREVTPDGKNRCSINGKAVNVTALREVGKYLADFHGQHDHQFLLDPASHLTVLDRLARLGKTYDAYRTEYSEYAKYKKELEDIQGLEESRERELDLLKYQLDELKRVDPQPNEDTELKEEFIRLSNAENLSTRAAELLERLMEGDGSAMDQLGYANRILTELAKIDVSLKPLGDELTEIELSLGEVARAARDYRDGLSFDPDRLKDVEARIDAIEMIKRKYGGSIEAARTFLREAQVRFDLLDHAEERTGELRTAVDKLEKKVLLEAKKLTAARTCTAQKLEAAIEKELKALGIRHARFECRIERAAPQATGCDRVEFYISPNAGEELLPLAKIISGGEASRVMLALKRALVDTDEIPTLIFDEIDSNIGGRLGTVVGTKVAEIAAKHQVLLITHLPQIASFAKRHIKVTKFVERKRTRTHYEVIEGEDRVRELTEMMAGEKKTEVATKHAREMLAGKT